MNLLNLFRNRPSPFTPRPSPVPDPQWPARFKQWQASIQHIGPEDPLWTGLLALVDENIATELQVSVRPGLSTEEAHRFRGRVGMLLDLRQQLADAPAAARNALK